MIYKRVKYCKIVGCWKIGFFGYKNNRGVFIAKFCEQHKFDDMIRVYGKFCKHPGCDTRASYGYKHDRLLYCGKHKPADSINSKCKVCKYIKCGNIIPNNITGIYCEFHSTKF
jgi:EsV-like protein